MEYKEAEERQANLWKRTRTGRSRSAGFRRAEASQSRTSLGPRRSMIR